MSHGEAWLCGLYASASQTWSRQGSGTGTPKDVGSEQVGSHIFHRPQKFMLLIQSSGLPVSFYTSAKLQQASFASSPIFPFPLNPDFS